LLRDHGKTFGLRSFAEALGEAFDARGFARAFREACDLTAAGRSSATGFRRGAAFVTAQLRRAAAMLHGVDRRDRVRAARFGLFGLARFDLKKRSRRTARR
jgi:hypothetical protein